MGQGPSVLTVAPLIRNSPHPSGTQSHYSIHKCPPAVPILNQWISPHPYTLFLRRSIRNFSLPKHYKQSLPSGLLNKTVCISYPSNGRYIPQLTSSLYFMVLPLQKLSHVLNRLTPFPTLHIPHHSLFMAIHAFYSPLTDVSNWL
jgi:hypothetical protein